jgi:hypothetical protein
MPKGSSFISTMVIGVREGQPMSDMTIKSREIDEEEKVARQVVR